MLVMERCQRLCTTSKVRVMRRNTSFVEGISESESTVLQGFPAPSTWKSASDS